MLVSGGSELGSDDRGINPISVANGVKSGYSVVRSGKMRSCDLTE